MPTLELAGEEEFDRPPDQLWRSLTDPQFLCDCFPGVDRVLRVDKRSAAVVVRPGFSFVRGTLDVSFEFTELVPPSLARVLIHIKGIGSSAELETRLSLAASGSGTRVAWSTDARQIGGLLKAVSPGLMQAAAQKVATDTWTAIHQRLAVVPR